MNLNKKGVSAVVASVMLILLVVVISSIIFIFAKGFVGEKVESSDLANAKMCDGLDIYIAMASSSGDTANLEVVNRGNVDIEYFEFKAHNLDGSSNVVNSSFGVLSEGNSFGSVVFSGLSSGDVNEIEVFPVLGGAGTKNIVCRDEEIYLSI